MKILIVVGIMIGYYRELAESVDLGLMVFLEGLTFQFGSHSLVLVSIWLRIQIDGFTVHVKTNSRFGLGCSGVLPEWLQISLLKTPFKRVVDSHESSCGGSTDEGFVGALKTGLGVEDLILATRASPQMTTIENPYKETNQDDG